MPTKILIIDHNDSFTYNLVQLLEESGAEEVVVKSHHAVNPCAVEQADGIVLSPGPGLPKDYPETVAVLESYAVTKPFLGVCMGLQLIVNHFGGRLYNLNEVKHGAQVEIQEQTSCPLFFGLDFPLKAGGYHSWAMDENHPVKALEITATLANGTVMALQHRALNIQAVQFHPESYMTPQGTKIIKNWLNLVENDTAHTSMHTGGILC